MKLIRDDQGQTLVLTALLGCVLMGFMALAIDIGVAFRAQRKLQTQADAAAIAGALCATYAGSFCTQYGGTTWQTAASGAATANGMPGGATFTPKQSPTYGQHTGSGYYEVIIQQPNPTIFMGAFAALFPGGGAQGSLTVGARAVAGSVPGQTCLYVLNSTADKALYVKGGAQGGPTIQTPNCTIAVNSSAADALCTTGGSTINSQQIDVVGAQNGAGKCNGAQNNVQTGVGGITNPFQNMTLPPCTTTVGFGGISGTTITAYNQSTGAITISNGGTTKTVTETPTTVGTGSANVICFNDPNVTLASGLCLGKGSCAGGTAGPGSNEVFVFQSGVALSGNNILTTINGTLDLSGGVFTQGNSNLWLNGPTGDASAEPYTGFALIDTSTANGCPPSVGSMGTIPAGDGCLDIQFGSSNSGMIGTLYAPNSVLYMQDSGGGSVVTNLIADEVWTDSVLDITNYNLAYTTSPLDVVRLVE